MTREQVVSAVARKVPFVLRMADGREYPVPHPDYISLPPKSACVIVYDDSGNFSVLPLLTMTGLHSTVADGSKKRNRFAAKASSEHCDEVLYLRLRRGHPQRIILDLLVKPTS